MINHTLNKPLPVAIVWCRPDSENSLVEMPFVALHDQLMSSTNHLNIICSIELTDNIASKQISCSSWWHSPSLGVLWVTPEEITHGSIMGNLLLPVYCSDLVKCLYTGTQPSVNTEYLSIDNGWQREIVKYLCAVSPNCDASIFSETLVIETIYLSRTEIKRIQERGTSPNLKVAMTHPF